MNSVEQVKNQVIKTQPKVAFFPTKDSVICYFDAIPEKEFRMTMRSHGLLYAPRRKYWYLKTINNSRDMEKLRLLFLAGGFETQQLDYAEDTSNTKSPFGEISSISSIATVEKSTGKNVDLTSTLQPVVLQTTRNSISVLVDAIVAEEIRKNSFTIHSHTRPKNKGGDNRISLSIGPKNVKNGPKRFSLAKYVIQLTDKVNAKRVYFGPLGTFNFQRRNLQYVIPTSKNDIIKISPVPKAVVEQPELEKRIPNQHNQKFHSMSGYQAGFKDGFKKGQHLTKTDLLNRILTLLSEFESEECFDSDTIPVSQSVKTGL